VRKSVANAIGLKRFLNEPVPEDLNPEMLNRYQEPKAVMPAKASSIWWLAGRIGAVMDLPFSQVRVQIDPKEKELHPDARLAINVEIETSTVLREPTIDVVFSGPVLLLTIASTELTKGCKVTATGLEAVSMSFTKKTLPRGAVIAFRAYSADEVRVQSVLTTGYTVH
jgi:hypothetical protein